MPSMQGLLEELYWAVLCSKFGPGRRAGLASTIVSNSLANNTIADASSVPIERS